MKPILAIILSLSTLSFAETVNNTFKDVQPTILKIIAGNNTISGIPLDRGDLDFNCTVSGESSSNFGLINPGQIELCKVKDNPFSTTINISNSAGVICSVSAINDENDKGVITIGTHGCRMAEIYPGSVYRDPVNNEIMVIDYSKID